MTDRTEAPDRLSFDDTLAAAAGEAATPPGQARRYTLLRRLGEGGMGVVHEAFDAQLDRLIALKVVSGRLADTAARRDELVAEARAMAKLAHPHVVTVFDVVTLDGRLHVAMELVRGGSLKEWLATPRPWRTVLMTFVEAGRGLAAAHRAGLVHRDFKPANVLLDEDGRPRVGDFGLARTRHELAHDDRIVGTVAYMAPEQLRGEAVDARADQYSFCAALWEALYGARPYAGDSVAELDASFTAGTRPEPPPGRAPAWVATRLVRGLAVTPAARYPDVDTLLAALVDDPVARRRRTVAAAALGATVLGLGLVAAYGLSRSASDPLAVCRTGAAMTGVWDDGQRATLRTALGQAGPSYAADTAQRMEVALDAHAAELERARVVACEGGVQQTLAPSELERRTRCLDRRRRQLAALVAALVERPDLAVREGTRTVDRLDAVSTCDEAQAGVGMETLPADAAVAARVEALRTRGEQLEARHRTGRADQGPDMERLLADAEQLGYEPALAQSLRLASKVLVGTRKPAEMDPIYERGAQLAARAGDLREAVDAMTDLAVSVGFDQRRPAEGLAIMRALETSLLAAGDPPMLRARVLGSTATILQGQGDLERAIAAFEQAIALVAARPDAQYLHGLLLSNLGNALFAHADHALAIERYRRALTIIEELQGPTHPSVAGVLGNLGDALRITRQRDQARVALERALAIREAGGPSAGLAVTLQNLGVLERELGHDAVARDFYQRSLAVWIQVAGPDAPQTAMVAVNLARTALDDGEAALAIPALEQVLPGLAKADEHGITHVYALAALGLARAETNQVAAGVALLDRARTLAAGLPPAAQADVGYSLAQALVHVPARHGEARTLARVIADGDHTDDDKADARQLLERLR